MIPITPTEVELTWGDEKFLPDSVDLQEAGPWQKAVWAQFIDTKHVYFQPKTHISRDEALKHIEAVMNCEGVRKGRRMLLAAYLCSLWFEGFVICGERA